MQPVDHPDFIITTDRDYDEVALNHALERAGPAPRPIIEARAMETDAERITLLIEECRKLRAQRNHARQKYDALVEAYLRRTGEMPGAGDTD
ncbi:MAG: hypothetical protein KGH75_00620 [Rhodospirillales bacterium]|nr:hypothetical protein [Rhodospirillales bacterium]